MRLSPVDRHVGGWHRLQRGVQALERVARVVQVHVAVVQRAAVVRTHDEEAHGLGVVLLQHVADGEEVAQALGHLLVVDVDKAVVHPHVAPAACRWRLRSGRSRFRGAGTAGRRRRRGCQRFRPAGAAMAEHSMCQPGRPGPRRCPTGRRRLGGLGGLPQHEVQRVVLAVQHGHAFARAQFVQRLARQLAVAGKLAHRVVHVATPASGRPGPCPAACRSWPASAARSRWRAGRGRGAARCPGRRSRGASRRSCVGQRRIGDRRSPRRGG
jgi:hypothetical protein